MKPAVWLRRNLRRALRYVRRFVKGIVPIPTVTSLLASGHSISKEKHAEYIRTTMPMIALSPTYHCSHMCWYCCSGQPYTKPVRSIVDDIGADNYIEQILRLAGGQQVQYRITGGEPTEHPAFRQILSALLEQGHEIVVQTNGLNAKIVDDVVSLFPRSIQAKLHYEVSFHLGAYLADRTDARLKKYLDECFPIMAAHCGGFLIIVPLAPNVLSSPDLEKYLEYFKAVSAAQGLSCSFCLEVLYGKFGEESYPRAYTEDEKRRVVQLKRRYEVESFSLKELESLLEINRVLYLKGMPCYYMTRLISTMANGDVIICGSGFIRGEVPVSGNLLTSPDSLPSIGQVPKPCIFDTCNCVGMGTNACLAPHGISYERYVSELDKNRWKWL